MFNPDDAYYVGEALPYGGAFLVGIVLIVLVGWLLQRGEK